MIFFQCYYDIIAIVNFILALKKLRIRQNYKMLKFPHMEYEIRPHGFIKMDQELV